MSLEPLPVDALAVSAHPDDVELVIGGTLLKLVSLGYKTAVVDMTQGESGTRGSAETRAEEAKEAAKVLGLTARETLALPDSQVRCDDVSRQKMVRAIRRFRPKVVFTHYWDDPHPDHSYTAQIVKEACFLAGLAKYDTDSGQERHRPATIAYFMFPRSVTPSFIVNVSEFAEKKREAIQCYGSQFYNPKSKELETNVSVKEFITRVESRQRFYGTLINAEHGEAFYVKEMIQIKDPIELLTQPMNSYSYIL
jgi:bacillithiol biosynthesis deacetylase BshB1